MPAAKAGPPLMVVIGGLLRERQFIRAPIKIILPARLIQAKVKYLAYKLSECRQGRYWPE